MVYKYNSAFEIICSITKNTLSISSNAVLPLPPTGAPNEGKSNHSSGLTYFVFIIFSECDLPTDALSAFK